MHWLWILMRVILILLVGCVSHGHPETIDEIISGAIEDAAAMDFMQEDGTVLVELDMKFKADDWAIIQQMKDADNGRKKRKAIRFESKRWTNNVVPYFLSNVFSGSDVAQIRAAMAEWERHTCLTFRPKRNDDNNYILIQNGGGCSSFVGMQGGSQSISLAPGCRTKGTIVHELGHAIGFKHEQTRPDRDSYVTINFQNIETGYEDNFKKYSTNFINTFGVPYDYTSVMHYGGKYFSSNDGYTIITNDPAKQGVIGKADGLSLSDIELANKMYSCSGDIKVRLVHGPNDFSGRVEVSNGGPWGTVCDDSWDDKDCSVICRMLGVGGGLSRTNAHFGGGVGGIHLDNVQCVGTETSIMQCKMNGWGEEDCSHSEDAGCFCHPGYIHYDEKDCEGNDIIGIFHRNLKQCLEFCDYDPRCVAVQYNTWDECWLKHTCNIFTLSNGNLGTIYLKRGGYIHYDEKDCEGNDIRGIFHMNLKQCLEFCDDDPRCVAVQYNTWDQCWLKHTCNIFTLSNGNLGTIYLKRD